VLRPLTRFLREPRPSLEQAAWGLRLVFVAIFLGQFVLAMLVALVLAVALSPAHTAGAPMGLVLLLVALCELPVALVVASLTLKDGGKSRALAATITLATILSTPSWLAGFLFVVGRDLLYWLLLALVLMLYYGVGFVMARRFAAKALEKSSPGREE
jgi:hypothetical protein